MHTHVLSAHRVRNAANRAPCSLGCIRLLSALAVEVTRRRILKFHLVAIDTVPSLNFFPRRLHKLDRV